MTKNDDNIPVPDAPEAEAEGTVDETPDPIVVAIDGHEYTIDPASGDDFELLDDLNELSRTGSNQMAAAILRRLLGDTQTRLALNRLRDEKTGRVSTEAGTEFLLQLLDGLNPN